MQRQGVEDIKGKTPLGGQPPNIRRKLSKAELREQALQHSLLGAKAIKPKTNSVPSLCKRPARTSAHSFALPRPNIRIGRAEFVALIFVPTSTRTFH
jgi:hypothetical protein